VKAPEQQAARAGGGPPASGRGGALRRRSAKMVAYVSPARRKRWGGWGSPISEKSENRIVRMASGPSCCDRWPGRRTEPPGCPIRSMHGRAAELASIPEAGKPPVSGRPTHVFTDATFATCNNSMYAAPCCECGKIPMEDRRTPDTGHHGRRPWRVLWADCGHQQPPCTQYGRNLPYVSGESFSPKRGGDHARNI
jgi:hypothetical protein